MSTKNKKQKIDTSSNSNLNISEIFPILENPWLLVISTICFNLWVLVLDANEKCSGKLKSLASVFEKCMYVLAARDRIYLSKEFTWDKLLPAIPSQTMDRKEIVLRNLGPLIQQLKSTSDNVAEKISIAIEVELRKIYNTDKDKIATQQFFQTGIEVIFLLLEEFKQNQPELFARITPTEKDKKEIEMMIDLINSASTSDQQS